MKNESYLRSLLGSLRRSVGVEQTPLVLLFEAIIEALPDNDKFSMQVRSGAKVFVADFIMQSSGRLKLILPDSTGYLLFGGTNAIEHSSGAKLSPGGSWDNASSRSRKDGITDLSGQSLLTKLMALRVFRWFYRAERRHPERHIGPMAEDFFKAFGVGDATSISAADMAAIALGCIQEQQKQIQSLERRITVLEKRP